MQHLHQRSYTRLIISPQQRIAIGHHQILPTVLQQLGKLLRAKHHAPAQRDITPSVG